MKYLGLLLGGLGCATLAHGQVRFSAGPRLGLNLSTASYSNGFKANAKYLLGGEAGIMADVSRGHLSLQLAALYSQKGFRIQEEFGAVARAGSFSGHARETYHLNYLALPLNVAYSLHPDGQGVQFLAGPYLGILLSGQASFDTDFAYGNSGMLPGGGFMGTPFGGTPEVRYSFYRYGDKPLSADADPGHGDYTRTVDAGGHLGIGYRHAQLLAQLDYSVGLVNLAEKKTNDLSYARRYDNRALQLSVSYLLAR